jgi:hypothetical protein
MSTNQVVANDTLVTVAFDTLGAGGLTGWDTTGFHYETPATGSYHFCVTLVQQSPDNAVGSRNVTIRDIPNIATIVQFQHAPRTGLSGRWSASCTIHLVFVGERRSIQFRQNSGGSITLLSGTGGCRVHISQLILD